MLVRAPQSSSDAVMTKLNVNNKGDALPHQSYININENTASGHALNGGDSQYAASTQRIESSQRVMIQKLENGEPANGAANLNQSAESYDPNYLQQK